MQYTHSEHPISPEGKQFLASLTQDERNLQVLAQKMLGSSYFIEKTHGFKAWIAVNAASIAANAASIAVNAASIGANAASLAAKASTKPSSKKE